ncbi:MAG: hypothetical protein Q8M03_17040 [Legionella sp.]|nr:hypothetical protein [Legionella sp.]
MYTENELQLDEIAKNNSEFTEFTLYRIDASNDDIKKIVTALHHNTHVTTLTLDGRYITLEGVRDLSNLLMNGEAPLKTLSLNRCGLSTEGLRLLQEPLAQCKTLTYLSLNSNPFGKESGPITASIIERNPQIEKCAINEADIGAAGAEALAKVLLGNKSLKQLSLGMCGIGDAGAKAFSNALKSNNTLSILNLKANGITDEGVKALIESLKVNITLEKCELSDEISNELHARFEELVLANEVTHSWERVLKTPAATFLSIGLGSKENAPLEKFVKILPYEIQHHILEFFDLSKGEKNDRQAGDALNTEAEVKILGDIFQDKIKRRQLGEKAVANRSTPLPSVGTSRHGFHATATPVAERISNNIANTVLKGKFDLYSELLEKATEPMQINALKLVKEMIEKQPGLLTEKMQKCLDDLEERVNQINQQPGPAA